MERNNRKILAVTGMRSEYDLQYSIARALNEDPNVDFRFVIFGSHLSEKYGLTAKLIERDGFKIAARIGSLLDSDSFYGKAKSAALLMLGLADILENLKPDMLLVVGDREEAVVVAMLATYMHIPLCHVFGGDKTFPENSGDIDEQVRHATTKMAHLHFPIHEEHRQRIIGLGEEEWRIFNFGSPALDKYLLEQDAELAEVSKHFGLPLEVHDYAVLIHHPLPNDIESSLSELKAILEALSEKQIVTLASFPNSDPGNNQIIEMLRSFERQTNHIRLYKNLARPQFHSLIRNAGFLIGNSSMGLLECPFLGVPAINVGKRQSKRINAGNVLFVEGATDAIKNAIETVGSDVEFLKKCRQGRDAFGSGDSGKKIARVMSSFPIDHRLLAKQMTF